jgi:hypothetical protein
MDKFLATIFLIVCLVPFFVINNMEVRFQVLATASMKITVIWDEYSP